jgi:hypothetical protein
MLGINLPNSSSGSDAQDAQIAREALAFAADPQPTAYTPIGNPNIVRALNLALRVRQTAALERIVAALEAQTQKPSKH